MRARDSPGRSSAFLKKLYSEDHYTVLDCSEWKGQKGRLRVTPFFTKRECSVLLYEEPLPTSKIKLRFLKLFKRSILFLCCN